MPAKKGGGREEGLHDQVPNKTLAVSLNQETILLQEQISYRYIVGVIFIAWVKLG